MQSKVTIRCPLPANMIHLPVSPNHEIEDQRKVKSLSDTVLAREDATPHLQLGLGGSLRVLFCFSDHTEILSKDLASL